MYNRPLVYYLFFIILGCIGFLISTKSYFLCICLFLIILIPFFFTLEDKRFFYINIMFLFMGLVFFNLYFNLRVNDSITVRLQEKRGYYCIANFKGRKVLLKGNTKGLKEGMKIKLQGIYRGEKIYEKGIIGSYKVENYTEKKEDIIYKMFKFKEKLYENYCSRLGKDKAAIVMALCCGDGKYISYNSKKDYSKLGIIHVLCVSGFHISIVYKFLELIFGKKLSPIVALLYVIFTGSKASAIRAYIMIVILKSSKGLYKNYDSISSLCVAAIVLLALRPYYILDIGFNLSFLSTLGIILFYKKLNRYLYKLPKFLNDSISISLSAQFFSLPYAAFTLNDISIGFLMGNIFLLPLYSVAIVLGNMALMFVPFKILFNSVCYILYTVLVAIEGGNKILLAISPPMAKFNVFYALAICTFYLHFILLKKTMENDITKC